MAGGQLLEPDERRDRRSAAGGLLELTFGTAAGEVEVGAQAGAAERLGDLEGGARASRRRS